MPIFKCRWVHGRQGVTKDMYGFTTVDLKQVGYKEEPFLLADQVSQVFYVTDTMDERRHVVLPGKRRVVGVENVVIEEDLNPCDEIPPFGPCIIPVILEGVPVAKARKKEQNDKPRKDEAGKCEICRICEICVIIWCNNKMV